MAIIPARAKSTELKDKNVIKIKKHPLISYSIEAAKRSKFIKKIFVTTDGKKIAKISKVYGATVIKRPKSLLLNLVSKKLFRGSPSSHFLTILNISLRASK